MFTKEIYMAAHEELIQEYLETHPGADEQEAYLKTIDHIDQRYREVIAGFTDLRTTQRKEGLH